MALALDLAFGAASEPSSPAAAFALAIALDLAFGAAWGPSSAAAAFALALALDLAFGDAWAPSSSKPGAAFGLALDLEDRFGVFCPGGIASSSESTWFNSCSKSSASSVSASSIASSSASLWGESSSADTTTGLITGEIKGLPAASRVMPELEAPSAMVCEGSTSLQIGHFNWSMCNLKARQQSAKHAS